MINHTLKVLAALLLPPAIAWCAETNQGADTQTLRVFIFAGQSNMVGTHSMSRT